MSQRVIKKIALAVFQDKKMLQVRSKKHRWVFFTLGGKIEQGEDDIACLKREVKEEIGCRIIPGTIKFLAEFEDKAQGGGRLNIKMYTGEIKGLPKPQSEIAQIGYFDSGSDKRNLSKIAQARIFPFLKKQGFIN